MEQERILCAAIYVKDGVKHENQPKNIETGFVIAGRRHHNCYKTLAILGGEKYDKLMVGRDGQGFITSKGRYVDRWEGYKIAKAAGQILLDYHKSDNPILISEDLY